MAGARIAAFVSRAAGVGVLVFCVSGASFAVETDEEADTGPPAKPSICLSSPKGTAPKGERWYYRVERGTKRHCWYTRGENERRTVERAPTSRPPEPKQVAEKPVELPKPPAEASKATEAPAPLQLSVANARAEANLNTVVPPQPPAQAAAPRPEPSAPSSAQRSEWKLAERWSNDPGANAQPAPAVQEITRAIQPRVAPATAAPPSMMAPPPIPAAKPEPIEQADDSASFAFADITAAALALLGLVTIIVAIIVLRRKPDRSDEWNFGRRARANVRPRLHLEDDENDEPSGWRAPQLDVAQIPRPNPRISRQRA